MHAHLQHVINPGCDALAVSVGPILARRQPALTATLLYFGSISHPTTALLYSRWRVRTSALDLTCASPAALHTPLALNSSQSERIMASFLFCDPGFPGRRAAALPNKRPVDLSLFHGLLGCMGGISAHACM